MLKVLQLAVLCFGLAFFLALAGLAYYSSSPTIYANERQASVQPSEEKSREKERSFRGFINFLFPDAISIFTFWLVIATILLGVIAYVQIDFLRRAETIAANSAKAAKDSADTAKDALIAANRPWIQVQAEVGGPIFFNVNGVNLALKYHLKNIGHSPATNIFVNPKMIAPAIGFDDPFNPVAELRKIIAETKAKPRSVFGFALFPDEPATLEVTTSIGVDELKRITQKVEFISIWIIGAVEYRMVLDEQVHQTGFIIEVCRSDAPRAVCTEKKRAPQAIFPDEGDVPAQDVRIFRSIIDGGYAD